MSQTQTSDEWGSVVAFGVILCTVGLAVGSVVSTCEQTFLVIVDGLLATAHLTVALPALALVGVVLNRYRLARSSPSPYSPGTPFKLSPGTVFFLSAMLVLGGIVTAFAANLAFVEQYGCVAGLSRYVPF